MARERGLLYDRMDLLGAKVVPGESGSRTLKDALNEALRDWVTNVENTFYIIGTVAGPHPYPMMVRDFQSVIGEECLQQMPASIGRQPVLFTLLVAGCIVLYLGLRWLAHFIARLRLKRKHAPNFFDRAATSAWIPPVRSAPGVLPGSPGPSTARGPSPCSPASPTP